MFANLKERVLSEVFRFDRAHSNIDWIQNYTNVMEIQGGIN